MIVESRTTSLALLFVQNGKLVENYLHDIGNKIDRWVFLIAKHRALPGGSSGALHRPEIAARWYVFSANSAALIASLGQRPGRMVHSKIQR